MKRRKSKTLALSDSGFNGRFRIYGRKRSCPKEKNNNSNQCTLPLMLSLRNCLFLCLVFQFQCGSLRLNCGMTSISRWKVLRVFCLTFIEESSVRQCFRMIRDQAPFNLLVCHCLNELLHLMSLSGRQLFCVVLIRANSCIEFMKTMCIWYLRSPKCDQILASSMHV